MKQFTKDDLWDFAQWYLDNRGQFNDDEAAKEEYLVKWERLKDKENEKDI